MEIIIIALLLVWLVVLVFVGYKLFRFTFKSKGHAAVTLALCGLGVLFMGVNNFFLKEMVFMQSKVYPDLYLVKNPVKDKNELNMAIKEFVFENVNAKIGNGENMLNHSLRFYQYQKSWGINLFADAGTAYFIENEEDPSGFVVEELSTYRKYQLAQFHANPCENGHEGYCGELVFFEKGEVSKTEIMTDRLAAPSYDPVKK